MEGGHTKSTGVTATEQMLAEFCERSFLKLWSYANPFKDDGHELCDLLATFDGHVFIFFDRENLLPILDDDKDPHVLWDRWKRNVVDRQVKTAHGAERYIRSGRDIFLDAKGTVPFPLEIDRATAIVHKIIVAHGAKEACKQASDMNIYGSLAITYCENNGGPTNPFHVEIDKRAPVHIFDSHNLPIVLSELDTVSDFATYLDEKIAAVTRFDYLIYAGEEDLLAHFLLNFDRSAKRHFIGPPQSTAANGLMIGEGEWHDFVETDVYKNTKNRNQVSYFWDELIQRTCQYALDGILEGGKDLLRGQSGVFEMVKEPRFVRRALAERILRVVQSFPDTASGFTRQVSFLPSYRTSVGYVFFQLRAPDALRAEVDYREKRQALLEIACGVAKNLHPHLKKVIGIGMDAPKFAGNTNSEDFILLDCEEWPDQLRTYYDERNADLKFFKTTHLVRHEDVVAEFVQPSEHPVTTAGPKVGRNETCPCGSGKKYKRCHGN